MLGLGPLSTDDQFAMSESTSESRYESPGRQDLTKLTGLFGVQDGPMCSLGCPLSGIIC